MRIDTQHASQIARLIHGRLEGDPSRLVTSIGKIDNAEAGSLCFLGHPKYEKFLYENQDITVLVKDDFRPKNTCAGTLIFVKDVYESFTKILEEYAETHLSNGVVDDLCSIDSTAILGDNVAIGKFSVIERDVVIGENTIIDAQVYVANNVKIGKSVKIFSGVKIYADTVIGDHVIIHSNAVIGSDGFGFTYTNNQFKKIPQVGNVVLESQVEIGSGTTIDRATVGSTVIKKGAKLDNLIQIGHNVVIGENAVIAAQTGVAGSSVVGEGSQIGGQVGIAGHLQIAPFTQIQAKSGVASSIEVQGKKWYGYPILPYGKYLRSYSIFKMLPNLIKRLSNLEKKISDIEKKK